MSAIYRSGGIQYFMSSYQFSVTSCQLQEVFDSPKVSLTDDREPMTENYSSDN